MYLNLVVSSEAIHETPHLMSNRYIYQSANPWKRYKKTITWECIIYISEVSTHFHLAFLTKIRLANHSRNYISLMNFGFNSLLTSSFLASCHSWA